jgi:hypothetical protein
MAMRNGRRLGAGVTACETFIHLAFCEICSDWIRECGRRKTFIVNEEVGKKIPIPKGLDLFFLCEDGRRLVVSQD